MKLEIYICGSTPLIWASREGHFEIVKFLISSGANIEAENENGSTSLIWASQCGHLEIAKFLIENGANIEAKNNYRNGCLDFVNDEVKKELKELYYSNFFKPARDFLF